MRGLTATIVWSFVAASVGVGLFFVKHEVKEQESRLAALNQEIHRNQEAIHVLKAEWSYLNDPARLRALSEKHLGMRPVGPTQVATLDTLPRDLSVQPVYAGVKKGGTSAPVTVAHAAPAPAASAAKPAAKAEPVKIIAKAEPARAPAHKPAEPARLAKIVPPAVPALSRQPAGAAVVPAHPAPVATAAAPRRTIVVPSPFAEVATSGEVR